MHYYNNLQLGEDRRQGLGRWLAAGVLVVGSGAIW